MSHYNFTKTEFGIYEFIAWKFPEYSSVSSYTKRMLDVLVKSFPQKMTEQEISNKLNITPRWLQVECKKAFGLTYGKLFRMVRVNAGIYVMYYSELNYSKIAAVLYYTTESNMVRDFKKQLGYTPTEIKEKLANFDIKKIKLPDVMYLIKI